MPQVWAISPVDTIGGGRRPAVATMRDVGIPFFFEVDEFGQRVRRQKNLGFVAAIAGHGSALVMDRCLALVGGVSLAELDNHPEVERLTDEFGDDFFSTDRYIDKTPLSAGWSATKRSGFGDVLSGNGVDMRDLTDGSRFDAILNRASGLFVRGWNSRVAKGRV